MPHVLEKQLNFTMGGKICGEICFVDFVYNLYNLILSSENTDEILLLITEKCHAIHILL